VRASIAQLWRLGATRLPEAVFSGRARSGIERIEGRTPPAFSFGAFECRLERIGEECDFAACMTGEDARALAGGAAWPWPLPALRLWGDPSTRLAAAACDLWIEFDVWGATSAPVPFAYFAPKSRGGVDAEEAVRAIADGVFASADGERCLQEACARARALPVQGTLMMVASLAHRLLHRVRLCVGLAPADIVPYLVEVGWKHRSAVADLLGSLEAAAWPVIPVQIDVDPGGIGDRVSFEFYARTPIEGDAPWDRLLAYLVERRLCAPEWPRHLRAWADGSRVTPADPGAPTSIRSELDVKISVDANGPALAKAYLGFWPQMRLLW
jgi:hypothetical protein